MFDVIAMRREIEERNQLRAEAGLPLLSVQQDLARLQKVWFGNQLRETQAKRRKLVAQMVLADIRSELGDSTWSPAGPLNGGYFMEARIQKKLRQEASELLTTPEGVSDFSEAS